MLQGNKDSPFYNSEGYPIPAAHAVIKEEIELEKKVNFLIKVIKFIVRESGFDVVGRIEIRDVKSGRLFK